VAQAQPRLSLAGQTLTPGLYQSLSSLSISSGDLSLDAQGNPNAVFIFQIVSSLTVAPGHLSIGGAQAIVSYSGLAPSLVGLYQVNAIVPAGIATGNAVSVVLSIGGLVSNTVTIAVQ
jgi:uncharacterized protein (TIGR03437 family)